MSPRQIEQSPTTGPLKPWRQYVRTDIGGKLKGGAGKMKAIKKHFHGGETRNGLYNTRS